jgi:hypothetical protein
MRRIGIAGLCLVAFTAVGAIGVPAAASAATQPTFYLCELRGVAIWPYEDARCSKLAAGEKGLYRKTPVKVSEAISFTSANKMTHEPQFKTANGEVRCKKSKGSGKVVGVNAGELTEVEEVKDTYEECKSTILGTMRPCENFTTKELRGRLGYVNRTTKVVGVELEPASGFIAKFKCETVNIEVTGCSIGDALPTNAGTVAATGEVQYKENTEGNGQLRIEIEGGTHKPCTQEATIGIAKERMWIIAEEVLTFGTELELQA